MKKIIKLTESDLTHIVKRVLNESTGEKKPPYIKNLFGGVDKVTKSNKKNVIAVMTQIIGKPITIEELTKTEIMLKSSDGVFNYQEYSNSKWEMWIRKKEYDEDIASDGYYSKDVWNFDKDWMYNKTRFSNGKIIYSLSTHLNSQKKIKCNSKIIGMIGDNGNINRINCQNNSYVDKNGNMIREGVWYALIPGTTMYNAVKTKVFKD